MISKEDYDFIVAFDTSDSAARESKLKENPGQAAKTFLNLLGHVSKDQTIQYILTMIDDMLQVNIIHIVFVWPQMLLTYINTLNRNIVIVLRSSVNTLHARGNQYGDLS